MKLLAVLLINGIGLLELLGFLAVLLLPSWPPYLRVSLAVSLLYFAPPLVARLILTFFKPKLGIVAPE